MPQILAAFISPNDPTIAKILKDASGILERAGHLASLEGYQSGDPARAYMIAAAIWSAVTGMALTYAQPPKSFEKNGQKIRMPDRVEAEGLATCLDTSLFLASAFEAAGLNPAIIFTTGHAFVGVWLVEKSFPSTVEPDVTEVRKAIAAREFIAIETTLSTSRPPASFDHAAEVGKSKLSEELEHEFERAIDVARARAASIRPLASRTAAQQPAPDENHVGATAALPKVPDFGLLPGELADDDPKTPDDRIGRWQRKLLDLSLRNRLLNFVDSKQTVPFVCSDVPGLEDTLAEGKRFRVISLNDENPIGDRDPDLHRQQTGEDIHETFVKTALEKKQVCVPLTGKDMTARLTTLFRKAKSDMSEGGTNTLFLAAGFLRWKKTPDDKRTYRAPLLLLPVKLNRRSAQSDFYLSHHEDDVRFNSTLLQFLERDFGLRVPALQGELPTDHSGLDLPLIFQTMRLAVRDIPGFEVVEDIALSTFSFAKYLMWKDLVDRTESLRRNRLVKHLIDNPDKEFDGGNGDGLPEPREIDRRVPPSDLYTPLPADSSQLAAVVAAERGHDFVIIGPPGTGKSQTIANMIAHCLAKGKSVLFVAEKSAALDVVYRRLKAYGLGDACLELHSNKTDRKSVIAQLGAAWDRASDQSQQEWITVTSNLKVHRDKLNAYVDALHAPGSHGHSVFEAIGRAAGREPIAELSFARVDAHDAESFTDLLETFRRAALTFEFVQGCESFASIDHTDWSHSWQTELLRRVAKLSEKSQSLLLEASVLENALGLEPDAEMSEERLRVLQRLASVASRTAGDDFSAALDSEFDAYVEGLSDLEAAIKSVRDERERLSTTYENAEISKIPLDEVDRDWRQACAKMWPFSAFARSRVRKFLQSYAGGGRVSPETDLAPLISIQSNLATVSESRLSPLPVFDGVDTDLSHLNSYLADAGELRTAVAEVERLSANVAETSAAVANLVKPGSNSQPVAEASSALLVAKASFDEALAAYQQHAGGAPVFSSLDALRREMVSIEDGKAQLNSWTKWVDARKIAVSRGLEPLIHALEGGRVCDPVSDFHVAYFSWWLPLALDASSELRGFAHWDHESQIEAFRELDERAQALAAAQVRRAVSHDLPSRDGVPRKSELGTLRHQLGLQRPSASIRQLIGQMPQTFTKLAPCVLMSPLSVAQYLPADHAQFDIVIFDEASQITTWDAVGAIARGEQSIIVGDPKQLPPTNFFGRTNDDDDDLEIYEKDLPSILDEASAAGLPAHHLSWHYRSKDEALIAFSNHHYYGDRLVTFPSPNTESEALVFHEVDGVYARGAGRTNEAEARSIAKFAVGRLTTWLNLPENDRPTLGVITFNAQQQELILDLLDEARRQSPELEWFFEDDREEPVIVKNLENIQGDERDVMLFSITFGPNKAGKMSMDFGAVNKEGGEKRLNVAVTRARSEFHVFSSITSDQIDLSRTRALGVARLKSFLDYAQRGPVALPATDEGSLGPAESPFEESVADALRDRGWEVRTQIGVSGFRIDLAVVHPDKAGAYLAGVECDGATYHSSASARDRDKIREAILRGLGWEIIRIWSTDWFTNPAEAGERVDGALRELLEASREVDVEESHEAALTSNESGDGEELPIGGDYAPPARETIVPSPSDFAPVEKDSASDAAQDIQTGAVAQDRVRNSSPVTNASESTEPESFADRPVADASRFFDISYTPTLKKIISEIVLRQGPIRDHLLARAVSKEHGWQRAGQRIQKRVWACLGDNEIHHEGEAAFVWPPNGYATRVPFRADLERTTRDISRSEIASAIDANPDLKDCEDPQLALARQLGISRLTEDTRTYLSECIDWCNGGEGL